METYIIKNSDVSKILDMNICIESVESAFRLFARKNVQIPLISHLFFDEYQGDLRSMPVYIPEYNLAAVKTMSVHPGNRTSNSLPTVIACIVLFDPTTGHPLAYIDGTLITHMRTGAVGGVASKYLANSEIETAGFVGAGRQSMAQLDAMMVVHPEIKKIKVYDLIKEQAEKFKDYCNDKYSPVIEIVEDVDDAVFECGIVNTTTNSRRSLFSDTAVSPGTHINAIGADAEGKQEMSSSILKKARLIIDDWKEVSYSGEINVPYHMGEIKKDDVYADLSEIISGSKDGRKSKDEITVFDSAGLALQDIVIAWDVFKRLTGDEENNKELLLVDFLS
jgi:alanine dehydrogenase